MATTENGIYYPNDYSKKADVPDDMKKMAESIDPIVTGIKQNVQTLQQEQQTQNTNISNLQKDNTKNKEDIAELQQNKETVNTQLETLQEEIKELEQDVKANAVIEETEKEKSLYISDASGARGKLDVLGNVEQEVTETGVNKFNLGEDKQNRIGLEVTIDKSKVTINGTTTGQGYIWTGGLEIDAYYKSIGVFKAGTYKWFLNSDPQKTSGDGILAFYIRDQSKTEIKSLTYKSTSSVTFTLTEDKELFVNAYANSAGMVFNNFEVLFQLQDNSIETENYEEFIPNSPSINYPSPLKILGDNINLFNKDTITENAFINTDGNISNQEGIFYSDYIEVKENEYFSITGRTDWWSLGVYNADKTFIRRTTTTAVNGSVLIPTNGKYIRINAKMEDIDKIKVEKGSIATSYSPYGQGSTDVSVYNKNILNINDFTKTAAGVTITKSRDIFTMNGTATSNNAFIFNSSQIIKLLGNYTLSVKYISGAKSGTSNFNVRNNDTNSVVFNTNLTTLDTSTNANIESATKIKYGIYVTANATFSNFMFKVQLEKGATATAPVEHQEQNYILDIQQPMLKWDYFDLDRKKEVHTWNKKNLTGTENAWQLYTTGTRRFGLDITGDLPEIATGKYGTGYCTHFKVLTTTRTDLTMFLQVEPNHFYIAIVDTNSRWADVTELKSELQELYNAGTPVTIYYKTAETTELDLTESQIQTLEQLNKLRLYKGVNNIFTTEDIALLQAEYGVDIQTKINNVISTQLSQIGGN